MVFTDSLIGAQDKRDSVEKNPKSLLVVILFMGINEIPSSS